ncbi:glycosyltransferase [Candidatus Pelagibacter sp.]|nr:glycosyltransferase [Candidatus Pelagibacter sp.]
MKDKTKIYYWCPFINKVATVKAVYNSVISTNVFSNKKYESLIIDTFGEWKENNYFKIDKRLFIQLNSSKILHKIPSLGFFFSRIKYILIFLLSYFPLKNFLKEVKPKFLIIHLMTSLPLFLNLTNNFNTKIILRISGKPKLNFLRYFFWKIALKKVFKITFPTKETLEYFKSINLVNSDKLELLYDPILSLKDIDYKKKNEKIDDIDFSKKEYYLSIGRLTKQKNYLFLIECFNELIKKNDKIKLIIIGEGEDFSLLRKKIEDYKIQKNVMLLGYKKNVFKYLKGCKAFILSSLWEDPGFVLIESMFCNTLVLSSDCPSGPKEILDVNRGILFNSNSKEDFIKKFQLLNNLKEKEKFQILCNAKKFTKKFSLFHHYKTLDKILI